MGTAAHNSSGELRLGLTATAAAAVLYGAVVVFGLGPASPFGLSRADEPTAPVVHMPHDTAAPGPALRLPQVSPGPERRPAQPASRDDVRISESAPAAPRGPDPLVTIPNSPGAPTAPASPQKPLQTEPPSTTLLTTPVVLDETIPTVPLPPVELLPPLPPVPELPAVPSVQLP
jgi:hypothetical protein